jgi:hypothetical protein
MAEDKSEVDVEEPETGEMEPELSKQTKDQAKDVGKLTDTVTEKEIDDTQAAKVFYVES